ncbi:DNA repair protein [Vibrio sp. Isolate25]|uniref:DNA repair protein n=1 Tax=Vibrio TaxID=662 RepID=UPI001EFD52B6|nr:MULTISPECIES: DNA repair protein [Vibrio]MCG9596722.1 DNA repair protein [Vibrio sp. Isolate25]MCG9679639.1 DNA repair protein [Vibrio sp. Isolate24]MCG9682793.1 DNA repair protein [Vibrio sp. Isolate23]USD33360.1 DNA repair protein [Vibrio sp. SCSIO 43186]USD46430.1 DNA repair protein [Vibrio sp. SCSIO 43145]
MNIGLIIALVAILLVLVLGYNIMLQYKVKVETARKQEGARYLAIIDATEELIGHAHHMPYSKDLLICLNNRILDAVESMYELDPKNKQLEQRVAHVKQQIKQLKDDNKSGESTTFKTPSSDKQAIVMLKLVKRLRDTIRSEHNKGRFETQAYVAENARLETIQVRINIENVIKRANDSIVRGQPGTAIQLLRKGLDALSTKNDNYSNQAREKLQEMYDELEQKRQSKNAEELHQIEEDQRKNDMDELFGEKKKW